VRELQNSYPLRVNHTDAHLFQEKASRKQESNKEKLPTLLFPYPIHVLPKPPPAKPSWKSAVKETQVMLFTAGSHLQGHK
jgi:hypothetical protein